MAGDAGTAAAEPIWHLALQRDWETARSTGSYAWSTLGTTLAQQGYVHASTREQVDGVARRFYAAVTEPLVLLRLDVAALEAAGSSVRWEDVPGASSPFPHVYGPIPVDAVAAVTPWAVGDPVPPTG